MKDHLNQLFLTIDRKDADGFVAFLSEDACFRFANAPVVHNKEDIKKAVGSFFSSIKSLRHHILSVWEQNNTVICQGEVTYTCHNGSVLTLPFVNIFSLTVDLITDYRVYIDISPLSKT